MIRWTHDITRAALIAGTLICTAALAPLAAQELQATPPAPAAVAPIAPPQEGPVGPRVRADLPRVEASFSRAAAPEPTLLRKKDTITVSTLALVLIIVLVVVLIVR